MTKRIGVLGSGQVGKVLADGFLGKGWEVMRGSRDPGKLADWKAGAGAKASTGTFAETVAFGEAVILAVKGTVAEEAVAQCGSAIDGRVVLDATNPLAETKPENGVIAFFTGPNDSLMERLQKKAPAAKFVKAFSCVGNALMIDPKLSEKPTMFICGNDAGAKETATRILGEVGWDVEDMGAVTAARAIEPLCMLWCIPGMLRGQWMHAFKLVR